jgi:hypothetical protein
MIQDNIYFIKAASPRGELGQIITQLKLYSILKYNNIHRSNVCAQLKKHYSILHGVETEFPASLG